MVASTPRINVHSVKALIKAGANVSATQIFCRRYLFISAVVFEILGGTSMTCVSKNWSVWLDTCLDMLLDICSIMWENRGCLGHWASVICDMPDCISSCTRAQVNELSDEGKTPLIYAIMGGSGDKERVQAIQLLVTVCMLESHACLQNNAFGFSLSVCLNTTLRS